MDVFKTAKPGTAILDHLSQVRLYLGVTTLADLCDDNGKMILSGILNGATRFRPTTPWPNQEGPSKISWKIWRCYLRRFFVTNISANTRLDRYWPLDADLGLWITYKPIILRDAGIEKTTDILYVQSKNGYFVHHVCSAGHMSTYEPTKTYDTEPLATSIFTPIKIEQKDNLSYIESLDPQLQRLPGNLKDQDIDTEFWIAALQASIVETASDGSVKDGQGAYAVIFTAGGRELWFQGPVDCHPSLIQSYRAELTGLLAI
eukprot:2418463-Ditylum_brightwellii.AAC.1